MDNTKVRATHTIWRARIHTGIWMIWMMHIVLFNQNVKNEGQIEEINSLILVVQHVVMRQFWPEWFSVALHCTVVLSIYFWRVHYNWWQDVSCRDRIAGNEYCTFVCVSGVRHNQVKINMFWGVPDHANTFWSLDCIGKQNCLGNTRVLRSFDTGVPHRTLHHLVKVSETIFVHTSVSQLKCFVLET